MSALQTELPGARVLDLFAGSGALGLETLSRGAQHVTFVERAAPALRSLRANVAKLGVSERDYAVVRADVLPYIAELEPGAFDVALADPPYGEGYPAALIELFAKRRFAHTLWIEHGAKEILPQVDGASTRRYGDTALTSLVASE
jgi:16S rRNA (guanine966-N2)-methyltransferase